ncbi:MAG: putative metal-binding domain of cation transport ATPase, partial [Bacteroidota bacterium]
MIIIIGRQNRLRYIYGTKQQPDMTANTLVAAGTAKGARESGTYCAHCGDPCPAEYPAFDEKAFCCEGCKTVYDIL